MVCSPARLAANKANAAKSTGPSVESRQRTRMNALKHGLTGAGVALPGEDREAIEARYEALFREFDPKTERAAILVEQAAYLSIRLQRCRRYDVAMLSKRVRHAVDAFHDGRVEELNRVAGRLKDDPEAVVELLRADPAGLTWMIERCLGLLRALTKDGGAGFNIPELRAMYNLMGRGLDMSFQSADVAAYYAMKGHFAGVDPAEAAGIPDEAKPAWGRARLLGAIEGRLAALERERATFDLTNLELDREEAKDRVLFDTSKEAILARRYEAATDRSLRKTFRELDELALIEAEAALVEPEVAIEEPFTPEEASKGRGSVASFFHFEETATGSGSDGPISPSGAEEIAPEGRRDAVPTASTPKIE